MRLNQETIERLTIHDSRNRIKNSSNNSQPALSMFTEVINIWEKVPRHIRWAAGTASIMGAGVLLLSGCTSVEEPAPEELVECVPIGAQSFEFQDGNTGTNHTFGHALEQIVFTEDCSYYAESALQDSIEAWQTDTDYGDYTYNVPQPGMIVNIPEFVLPIYFTATTPVSN